MPADASRLRLRIRATDVEYQRQLELILEERGPLIRGTFGTRARVCGSPTCRCARGERHVSKYLTASDGGRVRQVHVPSGDELRVAEGAERYRKVRAAQARLAELGRRQLQLVDALGCSLLEPYPPSAPLPPPSRRGRPPKRRKEP